MEPVGGGGRVEPRRGANAPHDTLLPTFAHRYQAIFEHLSEGIFLFDAASKRIVEANPAFLRLLGYSVADLPTLTLYDLITHDRASVDNNVARIIREGRNEIGERDYRRKDGVTVPVEVSGVALTSAGCAILCVVVRDLTARRQAEARRAADEARVREGEARLLAVVEGAPILLFTVDRAGIITFARGRELATLGLTAREVEGQSLFIAGRQFPDVLDNVRRALDGEEFTAIVAIGKHTFTTHYAPRRDERGAITGVIGVAANSTRRLRAEAAVRRYELGLTEREQEVLALLASDLPHRQIATHLNIGYATVRTHLRRIATKLNLDTAARADIVAAARVRGLLDDANLNS